MKWCGPRACQGIPTPHTLPAFIRAQDFEGWTSCVLVTEKESIEIDSCCLEFDHRYTIKQNNCVKRVVDMYWSLIPTSIDKRTTIKLHNNPPCPRQAWRPWYAVWQTHLINPPSSTGMLYILALFPGFVHVVSLKIDLCHYVMFAESGNLTRACGKCSPEVLLQWRHEPTRQSLDALPSPARANEVAV